MKKNSMRLLGFILVAMMMVSLFAVNVFAEDATNANVAKIGDTEYATLQAAIDACVAGDNTITLLKDFSGSTTIKQMSGVNITIEGNNKVYTGKITIDGKSRNAGTETLTFNNVVFDSQTSITAARTAPHNVSFNNCEFRTSDSYIVNIKNNYNWKFLNCNVSGSGAFFQAGSSNGDQTFNLYVENMTLTIGGNAFKIDSLATKKTTATFKNVEIKSGVVGFYLSDRDSGAIYIEDCTADCQYPVYIWHRTDKEGIVPLVFTGDNILHSTAGNPQITGTVDVTYTIEGAETIKSCVAKIGETHFATLAEAIAAAKSGDTITFLADITEDVTISKNLTIDGAEKTYTGKMTLTANTTIKNVNFDGKGYDGYAVQTSKAITNLTIEDCTAKNYGYGLVQVVKSVTNVTIKNVTVTNVNYGVKIDRAGKVVLENVDITADEKAVWNSNYAAKTITIKNSKLNILATWTRNDTTKTTYVFVGENTVGEFKTDAALDTFKLADVNSTLTAPEGQTVTTDVEDMIVAYKNGTYYVSKYYEAEINGVPYETLQAAIAAAQNGDTIVLLENIDLSNVSTQLLDGKYNTYFLVEGKDITVDLNGKTISGVYTASSMLVGVFSTDHDGKLTLTGNGTIDVTAEGTIYSLIVAYSDGASIIIENGTYKADKVSDSLIYYGGKTDAAVTVKGGTFELGNVGDGSNGKPWIFNVLGAADHYVYITGGTFNANVNRQHWSSEAVVDKTCYVVDNGDGTWTVKAGAAAYVNTGMTSGQFYIPKDVGYATFEEAIAAALAHNDGPVTLLADVVLTGIVDATGITINQNGFAIVLTTKDAALIAPEGLNVTTDIENLSVAYVNGTYKAIVALVENKTTGKVYESLADALADAKTTEGADVIVLLGDITAGAILVDEDITLDLQNYTLTITEGLVVFNGGYITGNPYKASNEKNAQIIVDKDNVALTNSYFDGEANVLLAYVDGAYVFTRAAILDTPSEANPERGVTYDEATDTYNAQFKVKWDAFMMDAEDGVLVNGTYAEHGIKIVILVTWDGGEQAYYYSDADVQACSAMNPDGQNYDYTFALKANGRENLTITIMAVADCGTIAAN